MGSHAVQRADWRRPSKVLELIESVIESDEGPLKHRQEKVVEVLEQTLRMEVTGEGDQVRSISLQ